MKEDIEKSKYKDIEKLKECKLEIKKILKKNKR